MYSTINGTSYITGDFGKYDGKVKNYSARYGRNSVDNYLSYISNYNQPFPKLDFKHVDFTPVCKIGFINKIANFFRNIKLDKEIKKLENQIQEMKDNEAKRTPINFVYKYMPGNITDGKINTQALMGAAYEELGQNASVDNKKLTDFIQQGHNVKMTAEALDLNSDGRIGIDEYAASILTCDALSEADLIDIKNINGVINNKGENTSFTYATETNKEAAKEIYAELYRHYDLGAAKDEFLSDKNNLVKQPSKINFLS